MNAYFDYPDIATATVTPANEEELASELVREGAKVKFRSGRFWTCVSGGLWGGLHPLARFSMLELTPPRFPRWGYRVALSEDDASHANASIPAYLIRDPVTYDEGSMSPRMARYVRAFRKEDMRLVRLTDERVIADQGYDVLMSWSQRTAGAAGRLPARRKYLDTMRRRIDSPYWMVFAGMAGNTLVGYMTVWSVDETAYLHDLHIRTDHVAQRTRLGPALYYESIRVFGASGIVRDVFCGIDRPEAPNLLVHKLRVGFGIVPIPSRLWLHPAAEALIRRRFPEKHYRLTGGAEGP